jgi:hypothetical protein
VHRYLLRPRKPQSGKTSTSNIKFCVKVGRTLLTQMECCNILYGKAQPWAHTLRWFWHLPKGRRHGWWPHWTNENSLQPITGHSAHYVHSRPLNDTKNDGKWIQCVQAIGKVCNYTHAHTVGWGGKCAFCIPKCARWGKTTGCLRRFGGNCRRWTGFSEHQF